MPRVRVPSPDARVREVNFVLPLRATAVAACCVALACLAALVVVAAVHNVDTLSTVALTLAIITFVVQLIVFIAQAGAANQQLVEAQKIFGQTQSALSKIGEQTAATRATVDKIDEHFLTAILGKALRQAEFSSEQGRPPDLQAVAATAARSLSNSASSDPESPVWPPALTAEEVARRTRNLRRPVLDDAEILQVLALADPDSPSGESAGYFGATLESFGWDELDSMSNDIAPGLQVSESDQPLLDDGWLRRLPPPYSHLAELTDKGRRAAALIMDPGRAFEVSPELIERVLDFRREVQNFERFATRQHHHGAASTGADDTDGDTTGSDSPVADEPTTDEPA